MAGGRSNVAWCKGVAEMMKSCVARSLIGAVAALLVAGSTVAADQRPDDLRLPSRQPVSLAATRSP